MQQHYIVQINLLGKTESGEYIKIAEIQSGPVIVRGRSPRNFDSRKDVPLTGDKKPERRSGSTDTTPLLKTERSESIPQNLHKYQSMGNVIPATSVDWTNQQPFAHQSQQNPAKKMAVSPNITRPPVPSWSKDSSSSIGSGNGSLSKTMTQRQGATSSLPINLTLSEDERSPNLSSSDAQSPQFAKPTTATNTHHHPSQSPMETVDNCYEYFPLSLDDWYVDRWWKSLGSKAKLTDPGTLGLRLLMQSTGLMQRITSRCLQK